MYFLGKSLFSYENHSISTKNVNFCEFCEKDARFQRGIIYIFSFQRGRIHIFYICLFSIVHEQIVHEQPFTNNVHEHVVHEQPLTNIRTAFKLALGLDTAQASTPSRKH